MGLAVVEMYMAFVGWEVFKTEVNGQGRGLSQRNQDMYPWPRQAFKLEDNGIELESDGLRRVSLVKTNCT